MFTGIIEALGTVESIERKGSNIDFVIASPISKDLKIDQSIAHNGVCLTVIAKTDTTHTVTAIDETLQLSNLGELAIDKTVNLERAMMVNARLDGHMIQGHVDTTGTCINRQELDGSWVFTFEFEPNNERVLVNKGSVCVNGVSLTVVNPTHNQFSVAIIPFTFEHTTFKDIHSGTKINLEFDIIGKYIAKYAQLYMKT